MVNNNNICSYCKKDDSKILYPTYDIFGSEYLIFQSNLCKAYFLTPRPDEKILEKAYDVSYYGEKKEKFNPYIEKVLDIFRHKRAKLVSKGLKNNAKVLDIGCGNGRFLLYLLNFGNYKLYGTELKGNSANRAMQIPEINLKLGFLEKKDFDSETFDAISMFHVFEHLTEPKEILEIISDIIKKDGKLVISFPNIDSFQSKFFKGKWLHLDPPRHLFFFAPNDFIELMKGFGFQLIKQNYLSVEQNPFAMLQSLLNCFYTKREILFERLKGNIKYAKEYSKFNIFLMKIFFVFTFPIFILTDLIGSFFKKSATVLFVFQKID